jgi:internalin A
MAKWRREKHFHGEDECYAEAQRRIKTCVEKGKKTLDLSDLRELKTIPPEISDLRNLVVLKISSRENIVLPESLHNLENLQTLSIDCEIQELPQWIGDFRKLSTFSISSNSIKTIPPDIGNLKKLRSLVISCSEITELPAEISECPLVSMELNCVGLTSLPESFGNLKKLRRFDLGFSKIKQLPDIICDWEALTHLAISGTSLSAIPERIGILKNLKDLQIEFGLFRQLPNSMGDCPLEKLWLNGRFDTVPQSFGRLSELKILTLSSSRLKSLPDSFGNLSSLEKLSISSDENLELPESFGNLSSLRELYLYTDKLDSLPKSLDGCENLKSLGVRSDALTVLPKSFTKLKNLKEIWLKTFALKELPDSFGNLNAIEKIDISSGALAKLPESLGYLRNLKRLTLDAYNVKELPESFKKLSYVEVKNLNLGIQLKEEKHRSYSCYSKKQVEAVKKLDELKLMGYNYRDKELEKYSLKELETLMFAVPRSYNASEEDRDVFHDIKNERWRKLDRRFKPTQENILRIVEVSDQFLKAWEDGFAKAKKMLEAIYEKEQEKGTFTDKYEAVIRLYPEIWYKNTKTGKWEDRNDIYAILMDYCGIYDGLLFSIDVSYDPATKDESGFWDELYVSRKLNWKDCPPMPGCFDDHYLSYAIHILWDHNEWAFQDITRINNIIVDVEVQYADRKRRF